MVRWLQVCALSLVCAAAAQNTESISANPPAPPGRLVDLGGYRLHLNCTGVSHGRPTVVLSAGGGDFSTDWSLVQPQVSRFTRVCSYDRSGAAWSDLGPKPRTIVQEAFDLHRLLPAGGEHAPYILVGQSLGGTVVRLFAEEHPTEVAGIVLVDGYSEDAQLGFQGKLQRVRLAAKGRPLPAPRTSVNSSDELSAAEQERIQEFIRKNAGTATIQPPFNKLPQYAQDERVWALKQPKYYADDDDYIAEISARLYAEDQAKRYPLGSTPLIVLTRTKYDYPPDAAAQLTSEHKDQQQRLAQLSSKGKQIIVANAGHRIQIDAPKP